VGCHGLGALVNDRDRHKFSAAEDALILGMFAAGYSDTEIGKHLGLTKNQAIGRRHRLKPDPDAPPRVRVKPAAKRVRIRKPKDAPVVVRLQAPVLPALVLTYPPKAIPCCWPLWGDERSGGVNARFCRAPGKPGRPYCEDHCAIAYVIKPIANAA
jgi:GcrA cell cycle regulator